MPILLSSSRKPCARTRTLLKDLNRLLPDSDLVNRGKMGVAALAETARNKGFLRVAIVGDRRGNPGEIRFLSVSEDSWEWLSKRMRITSMKLAREFDGPMPKASALNAQGVIADLFAIEAEDSKIELRAEKGIMSFWLEEEEIGPRLNMEVVSHAA